MKKRYLFILVIISLFTIFFISCKKEKENKDNLLLGNTKYGTLYNVSGINQYIDEDGNVTVKILDDGFTKLIYETNNYKYISIGVNSSESPCIKNCYLRCNIYTNEDNEYNNYLELIDSQYTDNCDLNDYIYKVWIEDEEGNVIEKYENGITLYVEYSSSISVDKIISISDTSDVIVPYFIETGKSIYEVPYDNYISMFLSCDIGAFVILSYIYILD